MGRCGEAFEEGFGPFILSDVRLNGVGERGDVGKVGDSIIFLVGDGEGNRLVMFCHRPDDGIHIFSDQVDVVVPLWVILLVTDDRFADGDSAVNL